MLINENYIPIAWGMTYFIVPKFNISLDTHDTSKREAF